jgi:hypothetical protein
VCVWRHGYGWTQAAAALFRKPYSLIGLLNARWMIVCIIRMPVRLLLYIVSSRVLTNLGVVPRNPSTGSFSCVHVITRRGDHGCNDGSNLLQILSFWNHEHIMQSFSSLRQPQLLVSLTFHWHLSFLRRCRAFNAFSQLGTGLATTSAIAVGVVMTVAIVAIASIIAKRKMSSRHEFAGDASAGPVNPI